MASACVSTIGPSHSWHSFPRDSLVSDLNHNNSPDKTELHDFFEFRLNPTTNTNNSLPADQLFFNGKLLTKHSPPASTPPEEKPVVIQSPPPAKEAKCGGSIRWRDLLRFKNKKSSVKHFLTKKYPKLSTAEASSSTLTLPLLHRNSDSSLLDLPSAASALSEPLPPHRFSLDEKPMEREFTHPSVRRIRPKSVSDNPIPAQEKPLIDHPTACVVNQIRRGGGGLSVDSPRMNHAGKIVFQGLGRSSSSPSSFNGGIKYKYKGMERSYSANVRVKPVLNVPICSIRGGGSKSGGGFGLGHFFSSSSSQKKDKEGSRNGGMGSGSSRHFHLHHKKNRL